MQCKPDLPVFPMLDENKKMGTFSAMKYFEMFIVGVLFDTKFINLKIL